MVIPYDVCQYYSFVFTITHSTYRFHIHCSYSLHLTVSLDQVQWRKPIDNSMSSIYATFFSLRKFRNLTNLLHTKICSGTGVKGRRESRATHAVVLPQDIYSALTQKCNDKQTAGKTMLPLHATVE